ncbi:MAG: hypothetical protein KME47_10000 [Nodosilinea sp. WJT8-NPBG4]|jgi:hypothetical protein|nr:hypothetical protein [Nodosilinea sp. WJT8-NPBG4]
MNLNSILDFIKDFVGWQESKKPFRFDIISQHEYESGLLLRVSRESITNLQNDAQLTSYIWIDKDKRKPYLYVFLDSLGGMGIRNLSHRIQVLSSERTLQDGAVRISSHLSSFYYLGNNNQANAIILKLILYCHGQNYDNCDWDWEITAIRKQNLGFEYTDHTQSKAREDNRYSLNRFEIRFPLPRGISAGLFNKLSEAVIKPIRESPKSRVLEITLLGAILIGVLWIIVNR